MSYLVCKLIELLKETNGLLMSFGCAGYVLGLQCAPSALSSNPLITMAYLLCSTISQPELRKNTGTAWDGPFSLYGLDGWAETVIHYTPYCTTKANQCMPMPGFFQGPHRGPGALSAHPSRRYHFYRTHCMMRTQRRADQEISSSPFSVA